MTEGSSRGGEGGEGREGGRGTGDTPAAGTSSATSTLRVAAPPHLQRQLGRYELLEVLGHGAMATVFRARDTQLGRHVAVKVMNLAVAARSDSGERFRREAQAVAAIKHPGIVEIFDFVAASGHEPAYIVSELIEGPTLKTWLDRRSGRVLPEMAALLLLPLAEALSVAHSRGIVHRDVKPDNVMIDRGADGTICRVVLTDFGVAHVTGLETMTATGALVGSPAYMSPEQARGHEVGPASDIWAAGVLLYEMATGHLPFTGRDPLTVVAAIVRGVYRRPSQVSPYAGGAFDEICARCLQPTTDKRYERAADLASDLRAYCAAAGLEPGNETLRQWAEDPERFEVKVRQGIADHAVASARKHARRGEFAKALTDLSRATAYVPKHGEADRLIAAISSRRRWLKMGAVAAAIVGVGAVMLLLAPRLTSPERPDVVETAAEGGGVVAAEGSVPAGAAAAGPAPIVTGGEQSGPPSEGSASGSAATNVAGGERRRSRLGAGKSRHAAARKPGSVGAGLESPRAGDKADDTAKAAGADGEPATSETPPAATPPITAPAPEAVKAEVQPPPVPSGPAARPVRVVINAERFFCTPGMDGGEPRLPWNRRIMPGPHKVFCQLTNGTRVPVATVEIADPGNGAPFVIQIRERPDGRPELDPARTTRLTGPAKTGP